MSFVQTTIEITDMTPHWGLVLVATADGRLDRKYALTLDEISEHLSTGSKPPRCTDEEWLREGGVMVIGRPCNPGQCVINPDGRLVINTGRMPTPGDPEPTLVEVPQDQWQEIDGVIHLSAEAFAEYSGE